MRWFQKVDFNKIIENNFTEISSPMFFPEKAFQHYNDVIMSAMVSQITNLTIVYSTVSPRRRSKNTSKLRKIPWLRYFARFGGTVPYRTMNGDPPQVWYWPKFEGTTQKHLTLYLHVQGLDLIITVSADGLAPRGARPSADTMLTTKLRILPQSFLDSASQSRRHFPK